MSREAPSPMGLVNETGSRQTVSPMGPVNETIEEAPPAGVKLPYAYLHLLGGFTC